MSWITARRRHPAAGYALVGLVLVLIGLGLGRRERGVQTAREQEAQQHDEQPGDGSPTVT